MLGAIAGDIIGSTREHYPVKTLDFELFPEGSRVTDDSVMTVATADALLTDQDFGGAYHRWGRRYRRAGYGKGFRAWLDADDPQPYQSWGNGSAMRVSPVPLAAADEVELMELAEATAMPTHDNPRGVIGAQAVALAIWLARHGRGRDEIRARVEALSGDDLTRTVEQIRPSYTFDVSCDGSVPEAIICALESADWEHAVRLAVSLGGDADTQASIAGAIAEAMYGGVPAAIATRVQQMMPGDLGLVVESFRVRWG
jgi:ADP-ribosylglycohydrolase